jgi:TolA-binding protein
MPRVDQSISLGSIINLAALLTTIAVAWGVMSERSAATSKDISALSESLDQESENRRTQATALESRIRAVESSLARAEERNNAVLQVLGRIEARLERIEQGR